MEGDDDFGIKIGAKKVGFVSASAIPEAEPVEENNPEEKVVEVEDYPTTPPDVRIGRGALKHNQNVVFDEDEIGVWGDQAKPFVGFKFASMTLRK